MTVRLIAFLTRVPGISFEDFDRHWTNHGALVVNHLTPVKNGLVKYKQFHPVPQLGSFLQSAGLPVAQYDGVVEWEAETLEDITAIFGSEEYEKNVAPDEVNFFHRAAVQVMAGRDQSNFKADNTSHTHE